MNLEIVQHMLSVCSADKDCGFMIKTILDKFNPLSKLLATIYEYVDANGVKAYRVDEVRDMDVVDITGKTYLLYDSMKREFTIPKKSGGYRKICSYSKPLYFILLSIKYFLEKFFQFSPIVLGGNKGQSIKAITEMLNKHLDRKMGLLAHLDIQNWYGSIHQDEVKSVFSSLGMLKSCYNVLATICTHKNYLPQGSPASTAIANAVASLTWAKDLEEYSKRNNLLIAIYIDNIYIAFNGSIENCRGHLREIDSIIGKYGKKTHKAWIKATYKKQSALGVTINPDSTPRVDKCLVKQIRTILFKIKKSGDIDKVMLEWNMRSGKNIPVYGICSPELTEAFTSWMFGQIAWIGSIRPIEASKMKSDFIRLLK